MSVKHIQEYYNSIMKDYHEMVLTLKDMEEECTNGLVSPDRVDQLKNMLEPIKQNCNRITYIMYLLNRPNKKEKQRWYDKQNSKKVFKNEDTLEGIKEENKKALENAKKSL